MNAKSPLSRALRSIDDAAVDQTCIAFATSAA
jgi:hypothetical protein